MFKIKSLNDNKIVASDEDSFRAWWSQDFQEVRIMSAWKLGSAIAFPQFFVTNGL